MVKLVKYYFQLFSGCDTVVRVVAFNSTNPNSRNSFIYSELRYEDDNKEKKNVIVVRLRGGVLHAVGWDDGDHNKSRVDILKEEKETGNSQLQKPALLLLFLTVWSDGLNFVKYLAI